MNVAYIVVHKQFILTLYTVVHKIICINVIIGYYLVLVDLKRHKFPPEIRRQNGLELFHFPRCGVATPGDEGWNKVVNPHSTGAPPRSSKSSGNSTVSSVHFHFFFKKMAMMGLSSEDLINRNLVQVISHFFFF